MRRMSKKRRFGRHRFLRFIWVIIALSIGVLSVYFLFYYTHIPILLHRSKSVQVWVRSQAKNLQIHNGTEWQDFTVAGVVVNKAIPGSQSDLNSVNYETYLEWLEKITEMNANTVLVQDIMPPKFYQALRDHNKLAQYPLFLLHGITLEAVTYAEMHDVYSGKLGALLRQKAYQVIDIIHGSSRSGPKSYTYDVSDWTIGYIVGANWDPDLVLYSNDINAKRSGYNGKYISAWPTASAFETVLATIGDKTLSYETSKYGQQRLLGYANWGRTDPLFHDSSWSIGLNENLAHVNMELITVNNTVHSGVFMAYHIEPNYPQFLSFNPKYATHIDDDGNVNPYRGYLEALNDYHRHPIVVTSFGVPTSRGVSNIDERRGFNQGGLTEQEQGMALQTLYNDILSSGAAGGCILSWTDSWGATAWNMSRATDSTRDIYWSNAQDSQQSYGILAYEPGNQYPKSYVDGDLSEWSGVSRVAEGHGFSLQLAYDEKYLYLCVTAPQYKPGENVVYIPLDITPNSGARADTTNNLIYDRSMDFVILIEGVNNSRVLVQEYYNSLYALYPQQVGRSNIYTYPPSRSSGQFDLVRQISRLAMTAENHDQRPPHLLDSGVLRYGNSNPNAIDFNSLADFHLTANAVEIRIPWALLNFMDPSTMTIHDDYYKHYGVKPLTINSIHAGLVFKDSRTTISLPSGEFKLQGWGDSPAWHTRLKKSYDYVKEAFRAVNP